MILIAGLNNLGKRYVVTGGPGVGKSTVILEIEKLGHTVLKEAARELIEKGQETGIDPRTIGKPFQKIAIEKQIENEENLKEELIFQDRGIPDYILYGRYRDFDPGEIINEMCRKRYHKVFILVPLPEYKKDNVRSEDEETARKIHEETAKIYREFGYELIEVPVLPPMERALFIIERTKNINKAVII